MFSCKPESVWSILLYPISAYLYKPVSLSNRVRFRPKGTRRNIILNFARDVIAEHKAHLQYISMQPCKFEKHQKININRYFTWIAHYMHLISRIYKDDMCILFQISYISVSTRRQLTDSCIPVHCAQNDQSRSSAWNMWAQVHTNIELILHSHRRCIVPTFVSRTRAQPFMTSRDISCSSLWKIFCSS